MNFTHPQLQSYSYISLLAKGTQSKVLQVTNALQDTSYALKLFYNPVHAQPLIDQLDILKQLRHKNLITTYDASAHETEQSFVLMEYMNHGNIIDYLQSNKLNTYENLLLIRDITYGLKYLHEFDLIHCNITPKNIFITNSEERIHACLGNFQTIQHTTTNTPPKVLGKIENMIYLPLDILNGSQPHTPESDIYALGITTYKLLTGTLPYSVSTPIKFMQELLYTPLQKPSVHNPSLSRKIDHVCMRAIAKTQKNRYTSIDEFLFDLDLCIQSLLPQTSPSFESPIIPQPSTPPPPKQQQQHLSQSELQLITKANQGNTLAMLELGAIYSKGTEKIPQHTENALYYYQLAAKNNDTDALRELGNIYFEGRYNGIKKDYHRALEYYQQSLSKQDTDDLTLYRLGVIHETGYHDVPPAHQQAITYYKQAAEQGNSNAMCNLGNLYYHGYGVCQNHETALKWYRQAGNKGNGYASYQVGMFFLNGKTAVPQDYIRAIHWLTLSATQGESQAMEKLGNLYHSGTGIDQDYTQAQEWYEKALEAKKTSLQVNLDHISSNK